MELKITVIADPSVDYFASDNPYFIAPSPNIPLPHTTRLYCGQCLWEGTNISEGRGTTQPFEIFGAPFLKSLTHLAAKKLVPVPSSVQMRPVRFIPTFHKFANQLCYGWQIHLGKLPHRHYESFSHSLQLLRMMQTFVPEFEFRKGSYEFESELKAIEILLGDSDLLQYVMGKVHFSLVREKMQPLIAMQWIAQTADCLIHPRPLISTLLSPAINKNTHAILPDYDP